MGPRRWWWQVVTLLICAAGWLTCCRTGGWRWCPRSWASTKRSPLTHRSSASSSRCAIFPRPCRLCDSICVLCVSIVQACRGLSRMACSPTSSYDPLQVHACTIRLAQGDNVQAHSAVGQWHVQYRLAQLLSQFMSQPWGVYLTGHFLWGEPSGPSQYSGHSTFRPMCT